MAPRAVGAPVRTASERTDGTADPRRARRGGVPGGDLPLRDGPNPPLRSPRGGEYRSGEPDQRRGDRGARGRWQAGDPRCHRDARGGLASLCPHAKAGGAEGDADRGRCDVGLAAVGPFRARFPPACPDDHRCPGLEGAPGRGARGDGRVAGSAGAECRRGRSPGERKHKRADVPRNLLLPSGLVPVHGRCPRASRRPCDRRYGWRRGLARCDGGSHRQACSPAGPCRC